MRYRAYRLAIESELELPELRAAAPGHVAGRSSDDQSSDDQGREDQGRADIEIRFGNAARETSILDDGGNGIWSSGDQACHYRRGTGHCLVTAGREIVFEPEGDPDPSLIRLALLGPALCLALMQRGLFLIHASGVAFRASNSPNTSRPNTIGTDTDIAIAFLGGHAAGKSTMAGALYSRGHPLVTDDVIALDRTTGDVHVLPSFPQIKLWSKSAEELGLQPDDMPQVHPDFDKWAWRLDESKAGMAEDLLPLRRLYVLGIGDAVAIEEVEPQLASQFVIRNWYGARFGEVFYREQDAGEHFRRCIEVTNSVPIRRLVRPRVETGFEALTAEVEKAIERDLAAST